MQHGKCLWYGRVVDVYGGDTFLDKYSIDMAYIWTWEILHILVMNGRKDSTISILPLHTLRNRMSFQVHKLRVRSRSCHIQKLQCDEFAEMPVIKALNSLLLSCLIGGLVFRKEFSMTGIKRHLYKSHIYSAIVLIFLAINALRWFTFFESNDQFGTLLIFKLLVCAWCVESLGHYVVSFISCECYDRFPEFFIEWQKIQVDCSKSLESMKKLTDTCTVVLLLIILINVGFGIYLTFWTNIQDILLAPWNEQFEYILVVKIINSAVQFYLTFAWFAPSALMFMICNVLAHEFNQINKRIKKLARDDFPQFVDKLEDLRRHHQQLCNLVTNADDIFSMHIALSFCGCMLVACLMIYITIYDGDPYEGSGTLVLSLRLFWLGASLGKVIMDCISGAILNCGVSHTHFDWLEFRMCKNCGCEWRLVTLIWHL